MTTLFIISTAFAVILIGFSVWLMRIISKLSEDLEVEQRLHNYYEQKSNGLCKVVDAHSGFYFTRLTPDCIYVVKIANGDSVIVRTYEDFEDVEDYKFKLREAEELLDKLNEKY